MQKKTDIICFPDYREYIGTAQMRFTNPQGKRWKRQTFYDI